MRKCIERVFGVLFKIFGILDQPDTLWMSEEMSDVIKAFCIIQNIVIEEGKNSFLEMISVVFEGIAFKGKCH